MFLLSFFCLSQVQTVKVEENDQAHWQENINNSVGRDREERPVYQWNQLVPLITSHLPVVPKTEASENNTAIHHMNGESHAINGGEVVVQAKDETNSTNTLMVAINTNAEPSVAAARVVTEEASPCRDATDADDDVFLTDSDTASVCSEGQKRRTQSITGAGVKEEPKSPRKVSLSGLMCKINTIFVCLCSF